MKLEEGYTLQHISISYGKRKLALHTMPGWWHVTYWYEGKGIITKDLSTEKFFKFCDKHRGKRTKGFNRPSMVYETYNTKENQ